MDLHARFRRWRPLFGLSRQGRTNAVHVPQWFAVAITAARAPVPWLPWWSWRWRFSLRTLLIVTTLIAVGLRLVTAYLRLGSDIHVWTIKQLRVGSDGIVVHLNSIRVIHWLGVALIGLALAVAVLFVYLK